MRYPNLTAEYEAFNGAGCDLHSLASYINVTPELMKKMLYGSEEPTYEEKLKLQCAFAWSSYRNGGLSGLSISFLFAPVLATIDPAKRKTRLRLAMFEKKIEQATTHDPQERHGTADEWIARASATYNRMSKGERVTYAEYHRAICGLDYAISIFNKPKPRGMK